MESEIEIAKTIENLTKIAKATEEALSKMQAPSTKVDQRMDQVSMFRDF